MPSLPVVHITGPNGEQVPVCPFPFPAAADELVSLGEWLKHFPSPAPKPTKAEDGFDVDKATFDEIWAYVVERRRKASLEVADADAPKAKL
ncbi:hypothetical protein CDV31_012104 [Fusarium ambrosium]|uniref:Uncharacterized protein n=1 Tax=Fusarium ambrosium TaxID=131363 RepID=A0A428TC73_9HYPO|nr:hypothetical protein CDV31_012104 [Fusarium ambrosium]